DSQWEQIQAFLPTNGHRGGQWKDHRLVLHRILGVPATGAGWRDLPERFGPWETVYGRFRRWTREGLWERILEALQVRRQADGRIGWNLFFVDGTVVRAHKAAAGALKKKGPPANRRTMPWGGARAASGPRCTWSATARGCRWPSRSAPVRSTRRSA